MKVRFSDPFLASHRINQRERMPLLLTRVEVLTSASPVYLLAVRAFVLSYAIHF